MKKNAKIYVAGHRGMVGSSIVRKLELDGFQNLLFRTSVDLDLRDQAAVHSFFATERPDYVFLAAAKVGGILANNTFKGEFLYDNLMIQSNVIHSAYRFDVKKLLFLGSSCIYPKHAPQPLVEDALLTGLLEPTNESYAVAKIAGIKMCDAYRDQYNCRFISAMPTNLYGPNDNYDLLKSHVLPALMRKFIEAGRRKKDAVIIWGSGTPIREFMHVDDLASACLFLMKNFDEPGFVNVGTGEGISISDLAMLIKEITNYKGTIIYDRSKPDGTPCKLMNNSKLHGLGWKHQITLEAGIRQVYEQIKNTIWIE